MYICIHMCTRIYMCTYIHIIYHVSSITYRMTTEYMIYAHVHLRGDAHVANFTELARTMHGQIYEGELQTHTPNISVRIWRGTASNLRTGPLRYCFQICACASQEPNTMGTCTDGRAGGRAGPPTPQACFI